MTSIIDNQNTTTETGTRNSHKAVYSFGEWGVLSTDANGVWVVANPGRSYASKEEAVAEARSLAEYLEGTYLGAFGSQDTLSITKIRREPYRSVVTICEVDAAGERDGFEDLLVQHDSFDASENDAGDIGAALAQIAIDRGISYE